MWDRMLKALSLAFACTALACNYPPPQSAVACNDASPKYYIDGTPTDCYVAATMNSVAAKISSCARYSGYVEVHYRFNADGAPREVRAELDCSGCRRPNYENEAAFVRCVETAASAARLPLAPNHATYQAAHVYHVGVPEDERMKLGWSPMDSSAK